MWLGDKMRTEFVYVYPRVVFRRDIGGTKDNNRNINQRGCAARHLAQFYVFPSVGSGLCHCCWMWEVGGEYDNWELRRSMFEAGHDVLAGCYLEIQKLPHQESMIFTDKAVPHPKGKAFNLTTYVNILLAMSHLQLPMSPKGHSIHAIVCLHFLAFLCDILVVFTRHFSPTYTYSMRWAEYAVVWRPKQLFRACLVLRRVAGSFGASFQGTSACPACSQPRL